MTDKLLNLIREKYVLEEIDAKDLPYLKTRVINFSIQAYKAIGLGHVSVMRSEDILGLMKMDTIIVNPREIDLPLYSCDYIYTPTDNTLVIKLYDTMVGSYSEEHLMNVKSEYQDLADRDSGAHWYDDIKLASSISKSGDADQRSRFDELTLRFFRVYLSKSPIVTDMAEKQLKTRDYVEGLLRHCGPSTDVFIKEFGNQKTTRFYRTILFGTE